MTPDHARRVSKIVLGRGLADLLKKRGDDVAVELRDGAAEEPSVQLSAGVRTLLGDERMTATVSSAGQPGGRSLAAQPSDQLRSIRWALVAADVLLCGLAALLILRNGPQLYLAELGLCIAGIGLGAWFACLALRLGSGGRRAESSNVP